MRLQLLINERTPSLAPGFNTNVFGDKSRWYIVAGLNKDFDIFDCQEHFFSAPDKAGASSDAKTPRSSFIGAFPHDLRNEAAYATVKGARGVALAAAKFLVGWWW